MARACRSREPQARQDKWSSSGRDRRASPSKKPRIRFRGWRLWRARVRSAPAPAPAVVSRYSAVSPTGCLALSRGPFRAPSLVLARVPALVPVLEPSPSPGLVPFQAPAVAAVLHVSQWHPDPTTHRPREVGAAGAVLRPRQLTAASGMSACLQVTKSV